MEVKAVIFGILVGILKPFIIAGAALSCNKSTWQYEELSHSDYWSSNLDSYTTLYGATNVYNGPTGFLMESADYQVPDNCTCGVLKTWTLRAATNGTLRLQVWEHVNSDTYFFKGENHFTVPAGAVNEIIEFEVPPKDRITIRNNYLIGWYTESAGSVIAFRTASGLPDEQRANTNLNPDLIVDELFDWSASPENTLVDHVFAIAAKSGENTAPQFTNLPRSVKIYGDATSETFIYKIEAGDIDSYDVPSLRITLNDDATFPFYYNRTTQRVFLGESGPAIGTYTMTFTVDDQCGNSNNETLTIDVLNWSPSMSGLPAFYTFDEETTEEVTLVNVTLTDRDNSTWNIQGALNVVPANTAITLGNWGHDNTTRRIVSFNANTATPYTGNQQFIMDVQFTDGIYTTDQGYFLLYVTANARPKITNLNNGAQATVSYLETASGDFVYAVSATDAENDPLTWSMTCEPSQCPFKINEDGVITATSDFIRTYVPGYDLLISVHDPLHANDPRNGTLTVLVNDIDDKPTISNLPLAYPLGVSENTPLGTSVYTVSYIDLDPGDTHTIQAQYSPTWGANYFYLNETTGILTTAFNVLDYEDVMTQYGIVSQLDVHVQVNDGSDWSDGNLTLEVLNVNEPPAFHQTKYTMEPDEQGAKGVGSATWGNWGHVVEDQDMLVANTAEIHTFTWDCGESTRFFLMDRFNGSVSFATAFDYDTANMTSPFDCVVTVTDKEGLTATTLLEVELIDSNDNGPVFPQQTDYYIFQVPDLAAGRFVGQVTATDADRSSPNNDIYYTFSTNPFSKGYVVINDFGNIYVNETWKPLFQYGVSYNLVVLAENVNDVTGTRQTATASVTILITGTSTTTSSTTDKPSDFLEDTRNVAWFSVEVALGGALLLLLSGLALFYTVQVKRYRWCVPFLRKKLLGLSKMTRAEKRRYYAAILREEAGGDDEEEVAHLTVGEPHITQVDSPAPPMMWNKRQTHLPKGPSVRRAPEPAVYKEPRPPLKPSMDPK
ncbi:protocadherin-like protein [Mya arenaria]|uniref:protocadherin-like protein n=1 Tax=Mya arenaria TaxID=6604 RepID=UPI0022E21F14|nr:protocadherin-like protein [Mya arenaria]